MFVLVLAAEADETRQAITFLIVCLVGIAALLALLTVWYWHHTSPRRLWAEALAAKAVDSSAEPGPVAADVPVPTGPPTADTVDDDPGGAELPSLVVPSRRERIEVGDRSPVAASADLQPQQQPEPEAPVASQPDAESGIDIDDEAEVSVEPKRPLVSAGVSKAPVRKPSAESAGDGLSDDDWAAVMKSAFDKLQQ